MVIEDKKIELKNESIIINKIIVEDLNTYKIINDIKEDKREDFIKKANPEAVYFRPLKTKEDDTRRARLYAAYLKKNLPSDYNLASAGDTFRIVKK